MRVRTIGLLLLLCCPSRGEWTRLVITPYGETSDTPPPQPLAYFTNDALLRSDRGHDMCVRCPPKERPKLRKEYGAYAKVALIGVIDGRRIYDVLYCRPADPSEFCGAKSIIVRVAPGRYREILYYYQTQIDGKIYPSFLVKAGEEQILGALESVGGMYGVMSENYFWFDKDGPHLVDFGSLWKTVESVPLPKGLRLFGINFVNFNGAASFPTGKVSVPLLEKGAGLRCCADEGVVEVSFRFERGQLIPTGSRYVLK